MAAAAEPDPRAHRVLAGVSRVAILDVLRRAGRPASVAEVAEAVGLHVNTARSHLGLLVGAGFAARGAERRGTPGRPRVVYAATAAPGPGARPHPTDGYRLLAAILTDQLAGSGRAPGRRAEQAGEAWGRRLTRRPVPHQRLDSDEALRRIMNLLDEVGFAPEPVPGGTSIRLNDCPFRDVARQHPDVVCGVHLGLLRGALAELGAPVGADRLEPFVEPGLCLVHLSRTGGGGW